MRNIDSYDSRYPLEYYEIGTIYSFYCSSIAGKFKKADSEYISKYSSKLLELQKDVLCIYKIYACISLYFSNIFNSCTELFLGQKNF